MTISVFGLYVAPEHRVGNDRRYGEVRALVQQSRGHIVLELFAADDGESVVVAEFAASRDAASTPTTRCTGVWRERRLRQL